MATPKRLKGGGGLNWQLLDVPFFGGMNEKIDPQMLPPGTLELVENGVMNRVGAITKRKGYGFLNKDVLATEAFSGQIAAARGLHEYDDSLVLLGHRTVATRDTSTNHWLVKGRAVSVAYDARTITKGTPRNAVTADRGTASGVTMFAWEEDTVGGAGQVIYSLVDAATHAVIRGPTNVGGEDNRKPRVVVHNRLIYLFYVNQAGEIMSKAIDTESATSIETSVAAASQVAATGVVEYLFDAAPSEGGPFYAYKSADNRIKYAILGDAAEEEFTTKGPVGALTVAKDPATNWHALVYTSVEGEEELPVFDDNVFQADGFQVGDPESVETIWGVLVERTGGSWGTEVESGALDTDVPFQAEIRFPVCTFVGPETILIAYTVDMGVREDRVVYTALFESTGLHVSRAKAIRHSRTVSRPFVDTIGGQVNCYVVLAHESSLQSTFFLTEVFATPTAEVPGAGITARMQPGTAFISDRNDGATTIEDMGQRRYGWAATFSRRILFAEGLQATAHQESGVMEMHFDFQRADAAQAVTEGLSVYMAGGFLQAFDGQQMIESGFLIFPEDVEGTFLEADGEGNLDDGLYAYRVYYEYINARGERERSTTWRAALVTTTAANGKVRLKIRTLAHTLKFGVRIAIYRTEVNPTLDSPFYRVTSYNPTTFGQENGFVLNNPAADHVEFVDNLSDDDLISNEIDIFSTGELDQVAPPAGHILAAGRNRLFLASGEDRNRIVYSKLKVAGRPIGWNDALVFDVPDDGGHVVALGMLNEVLIVLKETRIYMVRGDGPNNLGHGAFLDAELLSADIGCVSQKSLALIPDGLIFQSQKGIYLLGRDFQLEYIGAQIERSLGDLVVSRATVLTEEHQVRFLLPANFTLVYDYYVKQWYRFTFAHGVDSTMWNGRLTFARSDGSVYQEEDRYDDAGQGYSFRVKTAWAKPHHLIYGRDVLSAYQRIRRVAFVGTSHSDDPGAVAIRVFTDFKPEQTEQFILQYAGKGDGHPVSFRTGKLRYQKCQTIRFEVATGETKTADCSLTGLTLEVGLKPGLFREGSAETARSE